MSVETQLKLRHFRLIVAIHETGSLHRAAAEIGISQPAASSALRELEAVLDVQLFSRTRSGSTATDFGAALVRRGRVLLANVHHSVEEIAQKKNGIAGHVRVGILPASAMTILPTVIRRTNEKWPLIVVHVMEGLLEQLLPALERGDLDLIIGRIPTRKIPDHVYFEELLVEPNEVVCRTGHPLAKLDQVTLQDLESAKWVLPEEGTNLRADLQSAFLRAGLVPPAPEVVTSSTSLRMALIEGSDLIGVISRRAAITTQARGFIKMLDVTFLSPTPPTMLLYMAGVSPSPVATNFIHVCRREASSSR